MFALDDEPEHVELVAGEFAGACDGGEGLGLAARTQTGRHAAQLLFDGGEVELGLGGVVLDEVLQGELRGLLDQLLDGVHADLRAVVEVGLDEGAAGVAVGLLGALDDLAAQDPVVGADDLVDLERVVGLVVPQNEGVADRVPHGEGELDVVLHGLGEARVALVDEHDLAGVELLEPVDVLIINGDAEQPLHVLLGRQVAAHHFIFLEVDRDAAARDQVLGRDLHLGVARRAEQLAALLVQIIFVHF